MLDSGRLRRRAEYRTLQSPALGLHRRGLALARQEAMVRLVVHPVVVETRHRNTIGRAAAVGQRRLGLERESLIEPERACLHDRALKRVDREEMRVGGKRRRAEKAARGRTKT